MAIITQSMLDEAAAASGAPAGSELFGRLYLAGDFGLSPEQAAAQVAPGPTDYGVNGYHLDPQLKNLTLFVFQWSESRHCFQTPFQVLAETGMDRIFGADPPGLGPDQFLMQLRAALLSYQSVVERVFVHLVYRGDPQEAERSAVYAKLREDLEGKKHLADRFFGRPVTLAFQFQSASGGRIGAQVHQKATHRYPLRLGQSLERGGPSGEIMRVGFAPLADLRAIYAAMGQRFLDSNIRSILPEDTPTNRALTRSFEAVILEGKGDPLAYAFDHNGVTLYAQKVESGADGLMLTEPRLLNGAQTLSALDRFLREHDGQAQLEQGRSALAEMAVLCKVIADARPDFVQRVTLNNNRQNPVKPWNLHANDLIQLELQDKFREELGVYYERQERAFINLPEEGDPEAESREEKAVELVKLARTYLVSEGRLELNSNLGQVFEDDAAYQDCFHQGRLGADSRAVLLCYKVQFRLGRMLREMAGEGARKRAWLPRARSLVWALACQAMLNDPALGARCGLFGRSLSLETAFSDWTRKLAAAKLRPLISAAAAKPAYAAQLKREKFGFLKTRAFFTQCMRLAGTKWGWTLKTLGQAPKQQESA